MKKNININLFGTLYAIDEDACNLLENYLDNMKSYFAKREGGDEIVDDIEHRVAEHLWALKEKGLTAIDIDTVKQIICSIGNPTEVAGEAEAVGSIEASSDGFSSEEAGESNVGSSRANEKTDSADINANEDISLEENAVEAKWIDRVLRHIRTHRFYRDGKDKVAGGVMSGLCHYFGGGDPLIWRVGIVLLVMASFSLNQMLRFYDVHRIFALLFTLVFILYVALWLLAPVARTAEERLCMKGAEVTPESISRAVIAEADEKNSPAALRKSGGSIMSRFIDMIGFCLRAVGLVFFAVVSAFALAYLVCGVIYCFVGEPFLAMLNDNPDFLKMASTIPMLGFYWILSAMCCLFSTLIPLFGIVRSFRSSRQPMSFFSTATIVVVWIMSVVMAILLFVLLGIHTAREHKLAYERENTRNGVFLNEWTWERLDKMGWRVSVAKNISYNSLFTNSSDDPLHLGIEPLSVFPDKSGIPVQLLMSCKKSMEAGDYVLECLSCCNMSDATLSVWSDGKCLSRLRLDGYSAATNEPLSDVSWKESRQSTILCEQGDSAVWVDDVVKNQDNWHYLSSARFHHNGGTIEYRISIGQNEIADGSSVGDIRVAYDGMVKR